MSFNQVIASLIDNSRLTQKEIAQRMGMPMPNIITMWKQGQTKVPPERVPAMAKALAPASAPARSAAFAVFPAFAEFLLLRRIKSP